MTESESHVLFQGACASCGSTDAFTAYDDGHSHCFACGETLQARPVVQPGRSNADVPPMLPDVDTSVPLGKRRIPIQTLRKWGYGRAKVKDTYVQVATYCDTNGEPVAQKLRHPDKRFTWRGERRRASPLYGMWLWSGQGRRVVVTEGELDALSVSAAQDDRWPVVSLPDGASGAAKALQRAADWLAGYEEVVLLFDNDEIGQEAAREAARALPPGKAKIVRLPLKDASDMLQAGRSDELVKATWQGVPYRPDGLVTGVDALEHLRRKVPPAVAYPFPELQAVTGGLRSREITLLVAGSGAGKSTLSREIALSLAERGEKVGYVALEENVQRTMLDLTGMRINRNLREPVYSRGDLTALDEPDVEAAARWASEMFVFYDHFGSLKGDRLRDVMRHMILAEGCRFVVLDHVSIVVSGGNDPDERKAIDHIMTATRQMVEETGVGMIVVSHLKRRSGDGKGYEEGAIPRLSDARGSASLEQLSDTVIAGARNMTGSTPEEQATRLFVLKNRAMSRLGPAGALMYDVETGRLVPMAATPPEEMFDAVPDEREY